MSVRGYHQIMSTYFDHFLEAYRQTTFEFGVADIFMDDSLGVADRVGSFVLLMNQATLGKGGDHVRGVLVVAPPVQSKLGCDQKEIERATQEAAEALFKRSLSEQEKGAVAKFVRVVHADNFLVSSAVGAMKSTQQGSAVVVPYAALYRIDGQSAPPLPSAPLPDDIWVPHLCELAVRSVAVAKAQKFYLLLDTGESSPQRPENYERMKSIDGLGVFGIYSTHDAGKVIAEQIASWRSLAEEGRLGSVFASIDRLPSWMDAHKSFLKLQLIESVAPPEEILRFLREDPTIRSKADSRAKLKIAQIAERANNDQLSLELLRSAVKGLRSAEDFLLAADLADDLAEFELVEQILARADDLFPGSSSFLDQRLGLYLRTRRYSDLVQHLLDSKASIDPRRRFFFLTVGSAFFSGEAVDFGLLFETVISSVPEYTNWCQFVCGNEAIERRQYLQGIKICMPESGRSLSEGTATVLIAALKDLLLQRTGGGQKLAISGDEMVPPVSAVIAYLSNNPRDAGTRQKLTSLLSVETSGLLGLVVLVAITNRLSRAVKVKESAAPMMPKPRPDADACLAVVEDIFKWAAGESPLIPGRTRVPKELFAVPPDAVFALIKNTLKSNSDLRATPQEDTFYKIMMVGLIVAPQTAEPDEDLDLLRYAGARYIGANKFQLARDLAEQALQSAANTPVRKRLAWIAFADIYHRVRSFNEALLGLCCALSIDIPIDAEQLYHERSLLIRIYRDIHFTSDAKQLADHLLTLSSELGLDRAYSQRVRTLVLQIRMIDVFQRSDNLKNELPQLTNDVAQHCVELVEEGEEISPAVAILAQCVQQSIARGIEVNEKVKKVLETRLGDVARPVADLVKLLDASSTSGSELLKLAKSIQVARNPEDIAFDLMILGITTRRFLDTTMDDGDTATAAFALEALTDHALNDTLIGTEDSPFKEMGRSLAIAGDLSRKGIDVVMLGLSEKGILVRLHVANGVGHLEREPENVFDGSKFQTWTQKYPYGYALAKDTTNLFYLTLSGIGISLAPQRPTLLVMDNSLQQMPPNLILAGEDFAGRQAPMAAAPSLSWVWKMISRTFSTSKKVAWISTEYAEDRNPALIMVAERLRETFDTEQIILYTSAEIPDDLAESEIAVIAAHGGILPEGRYIQRISDDAQLALYPAALAKAVRASGVVVLFICSGGRLDTHPVAETTVGIVRQILNQGCATVIASPWPLDTRVPSHWLPKFLERWNAGDSVIEATFAANENVMKEMGDSPLESLAMNLFGDPLRKKSFFVDRQLTLS